MPKDIEGLRVDLAQTKRLIDGYIQYRFRQALSPEGLAEKAGVKPEITERLLAQQTVGDADLTRVANVLGVSGSLLRQICGIDPTSQIMIDTINGFLAHNAPGERAREAHG